MVVCNLVKTVKSKVYGPLAHENNSQEAEDEYIPVAKEVVLNRNI